MDTTPIPVDWEHPLVCPSLNYWDTFNILEQEWKWKTRYKTEPVGSQQFLEYMFWREVSVVWVCAAIEGFVNEEGAGWVGPDWYKKHIERGRIGDKIEILYTLKYRKLLPAGLSQIKKLNDLFALRGELVHPKTRAHKPDVARPKPPLDVWDMEFDELRSIFRGIATLFQPPGLGEAPPLADLS